MPTCPLSKASQEMEVISASFANSGQEAKLNRGIKLGNHAPDPHIHLFHSPQCTVLLRCTVPLSANKPGTGTLTMLSHHNGKHGLPQEHREPRQGGSSATVRQRWQAYLCRWSRSPRSPVCKYSCVPGQCWCRWHSHHSCAARCHIRRALFAGKQRKRDTFC